ncbi:MAG: SigmaK-factor processing regulatory BofA [Clostridiales bacterium GWC2_40_7]|nr:MAG: SigmaK-factor processing regulatory BofA [Clostridiales bacterium GWC2_40_7]
MEINYSVILAYTVGIILLFILGRVLLVPMKVVLKLVYNALLGAIALIALNFVGGLLGFHITFNIITALIVGTLGIPGLILLIILELIFNIM